MRARVLAVTCVALAGCAGGPDGVRPIGTGPRYRLQSLSAATAAGRPVGDLHCVRRRPVAWVHVELFGGGRVLRLPAGVGIAPPRVVDGAYVRGGRCRYPIWTDEPTGLVAVARTGLRIGDLFAVWGRRLGPHRLAGFTGPVTAHVDGRRWRGAPAAIPLHEHAQVVLQAGGPLVPPHATYTFPEGR